MTWAWKFAFWIFQYFAPVAIGLYLDHLLRMPTLPTWPLGLITLVTIVLIASASGRALRLYGHTKIVKRLTPPDKLVTTSVFSCMRHPNQFSMSFMPLAISLLLGSPCGVALSGWGVALGLAFILYVEEHEVHQRFCPEYCEYAKKVKAISLNPKCLIEAIKIFMKRKPPAEG